MALRRGPAREAAMDGAREGRDGLEGQAVREVLESLPNPVFVRNLAGQYVLCNRAMEQYLGRSREEILGRTLQDLVEPEQAAFFRAKDEELLRTGGRQVFRVDVKRQDGASRHLLFARALWIDGRGDVAGIVTHCQDITEFRESEAEHLESEARLRAALDGLQEREAQFRALFTAGDSIKLLLAPEGGWILDANPAAEAFLGFDLATLRTMSISQFSGLGEAELSASVRRTIQDQGAEYERTYRVGSGALREVSVHAAPVEIKGKTYLWATLHDITEGKKAEAALRESEERLKSLAESIEVIVLRFDPGGRCTYVNGHYERVTGLPPAALLAQDWARVLHPEDRGRILEGWAEARRLVQVHETEFRLLNGREEELWVLGRTTPERDAEGAVASFLTTCTDITRFRRAEEALRQAAKQESLGLMAGSIANDFNNILQAAWTSLELAESTPQDAAKVVEALAWARGSLVKAKRITQFIQQFSGQGARRPVEVDLARAVQEFAAAQTLPDPGLRLETASVPGLPAVSLDPDQLAQCLKAVVANAVEAMEGCRGTIRILVRRPGRFNGLNGAWILRPRPGEAVELVVENDGPPIPKGELQRIFDPYVTTKEKGRGLGLSAVAGIVRAHQGGLWAESMPDRGVRIHILWPSALASEAALAPLPGGPGAILVVDDETDVLQVVSRLLEDMTGRKVLVASTGEEAVRIVRARKGSVAAVLMDANMPGMDGTAAFQAIRALNPGIRGILFSGCDEAEGLALARDYGFSGFIKKPFDAGELKSAFEALLAKARV
jgi:two-component system cell cycle sensor histidine kinase/response regulator CckA